jgi:1,5-anhydro-D-fructose reductase (1,5-anhydro-D-mannitol-forming)
MPNEDLRFGLVGHGLWGPHHGRAIAGTEGAVLAAVAERSDEGRAAAEKEHPEAEVYDDYQRILERDDIEAVDIVVPSHLHYEIAAAALEAGKHVLVEKPMALGTRDCHQMLAACEKNNVKLQVGYMRRFHPHHAKIKQLIDRGRLGQIVEARIQTHLWYPTVKGSWRQDPARGGGGAFMDVGSHCLELLELLLGKIKWVQGFAENVVFDYPVEDFSLAIVKCDSGAVGIIDASFAVPHRENAIEVYGTKGTLLARRTAGPFTDPELVLLDDRGTTPIAVRSTKDQYRGEFEHFADAILNDRQPEIDGRAGLRNLQQILAVYKSAREKRRVHVKGNRSRGIRDSNGRDPGV